MSARLQLLVGTLAVAIALPWSGPLSPAALERAIQSQMNDGAGATVTHDVACARKSRAGDTVRYACTLHGSDTSLRVRVDVNGRDWRAYWAPVEG